MTNYDFAIKHRQAFIVYCQASGQCANPHDSLLAARFRKAVEKKLKAIRSAHVPSKPNTFALIGGQKATVTARVPTGAVTTDTFAIRDTAKPRNAGGLVFDNANGIFI